MVGIELNKPSCITVPFLRPHLPLQSGKGQLFELEGHLRSCGKLLRVGVRGEGMELPTDSIWPTDCPQEPEEIGLHAGLLHSAVASAGLDYSVLRLFFPSASILPCFTSY